MFNHCHLILLLCCFFIPLKSTSELINLGESNRTCLQEACEIINKEENTTDIENEFSSSTLDAKMVEVTVGREISNSISWEITNSFCPVDMACNSLPVECLNCKFNFTCVYGEIVNVSCQAIPKKCEGSRNFERVMKCQYCYQTAPEDHSCNATGYCNTAANPIQKYRSNCTAKSHVLCLGKRTFFKNARCNWTSGYKWSTTLLLSITLGGFGADRFYLGHWQEGIGKLFSFGGAGVWTLVDVILVAVGYLKPADGSVYI